MTQDAELKIIEEFARRSPISDWLGFSVSRDGDNYLFHLKFAEQHIGNAMIRALHGGAIAAFLEFAAEATLHSHTGGHQKITTINCDVDYLNSAKAQDMTARVRLVRVGRRIAFAEALGWQKDESSPVANGRFRFRLGEAT